MGIVKRILWAIQELPICQPGVCDPDTIKIVVLGSENCKDIVNAVRWMQKTWEKVLQILQEISSPPKFPSSNKKFCKKLTHPLLHQGKKELFAQQSISNKKFVWWVTGHASCSNTHKLSQTKFWKQDLSLSLHSWEKVPAWVWMII